MARDDQLVLPRAVSYAIDRSADVRMSPAKVVSALTPAFALLGLDEAGVADLVQRASKKRTTTPTSDVYFLARASGRVKLARGSATRLERNAVVLADGESLPADVVVKCFGFGRCGATDAAVTHAEGSADENAAVADAWGFKFVDEAKRVFLSSSTSSESFVPNLNKDINWPSNVLHPTGPAERCGRVKIEADRIDAPGTRFAP